MVGGRNSRSPKKTKIRGIGAVVIVLVLLAAVLWQNGFFDGGTSVADGSCRFFFADVGQGDCTVFQTENACVVVDAGPGSAAENTGDFISDLTDTVDYFILTHPDEDHIGGAATVLERVAVKNVIMSDAVKDTRVFNDLLDALEKTEVNVIRAVPDERYEADGIEITIFGPIGSFDDYEDYNEYSVVTKVQFGETSVLMMGDAEKGAEEKILKKYGSRLSSDVLKLGHHGSSTSTGETFFKAVSPDYAVISCGKDNSYGHPHKETLMLLQKYGISPLRTDADGTIMLISDGQNISRK